MTDLEYIVEKLNKENSIQTYFVIKWVCEVKIKELQKDCIREIF